jgi:CheY-like chemotaxis protein
VTQGFVPRVVVIGEALIDLVDSGESPYLAHAGGGPFNIAIGLARLGTPTAMLARFSQDPLGTVLLQHAWRSRPGMRERVDVVLMDIRMANVDGIEAPRRLVARHPLGGGR